MYHIACDPEHWESQQQALQYLDSNRRLITHLYRTGDDQLCVTRAWSEQIYITRRDG
jgi:hypothetical protein